MEQEDEAQASAPNAEIEQSKGQSTPKLPQVRTKNLPQIIHVSEADLRHAEDEPRRKAGIAGAYIQPEGSARFSKGDRDRKGYYIKKQSLVMVFKSKKLKDEEWLPSQAGAWVKDFEDAGVDLNPPVSRRYKKKAIPKALFSNFPEGEKGEGFEAPSSELPSKPTTGGIADHAVETDAPQDPATGTLYLTAQRAQSPISLATLQAAYGPETSIQAQSPAEENRCVNSMSTTELIVGHQSASHTVPSAQYVAFSSDNVPVNGQHQPHYSQYTPHTVQQNQPSVATPYYTQEQPPINLHQTHQTLYSYNFQQAQFQAPTHPRDLPKSLSHLSAYTYNSLEQPHAPISNGVRAPSTPAKPLSAQQFSPTLGTNPQQTYQITAFQAPQESLQVTSGNSSAQRHSNEQAQPSLEDFERIQKRRASDESYNPAKRAKTGELPELYTGNDIEQVTLEESDLEEAPAWQINKPSPPPNALALKGKYEREAEIEKGKNAAFEASLTALEPLETPDAMLRLASAYNDQPGLLIIREDQSAIEFLVKSQGTPTSVLSITIQHVIKPTISVEGSRPMELCVLCTDDDQSHITYRFNIGLTAVARTAANVFRAKLADLKFQMDMKEKLAQGHKIKKGHTMPRITDADEIAVVQSYSCPKCQKRFKNRDGVMYHLNKSQTTCNPNYAGPIREPKRGRPSKPRVPKSAPKPKSSKAKIPKKTQDSSIRASMKFTPNSESREPDAGEVDGSDGSESEDSVVEFYQKIIRDQEKAAGRAISETRSTRSNTVAPSFPITPDTSHMDTRESQSSAPPLERVGSEESDIHPTKRRAHAKPIGMAMKKPQSPKIPKVSETWRDLTEDEVLRDLNLEMDHIQDPLTEAYLSKEILSDDPLPAVRVIKYRGCREVILKTVEANSGIFPGNNGIWYVFVPMFIKRFGQSRVLPTSQLCRDTVNSLVTDGKLQLHTWKFVDRGGNTATGNIVTLPTFELSTSMSEDMPDISIMGTMKSLVEMEYPRHHVPSSANINANLLSRLRKVSEPSVPTWQTGTKEERFSTPIPPTKIRRTTRRISRLASELGSNNVDLHEEQYAEQPKAKKRIRETPKQRAARVALELQTWRQEPPLMQDETGAWGTTPVRVIKALNQRHSRSPLTAEQKAERVVQAEVKKSMWQQEPPALQNSATGAWGSSPLRVRGKRHQLRNPVEPVTYLQDEVTGTWSFRLFGHGVKPICQRPNRKNEAKTGHDYHMSRIGKGFRPVPPPKNPVSKILKIFTKVQGTLTTGRRGSSAILDRSSTSKRRRASVLSQDAGFEDERPAKRRHISDDDFVMEDAEVEEDEADFAIEEEEDQEDFGPAPRISTGKQKQSRKLKSKAALETEKSDEFTHVDREDTPIEIDDDLERPLASSSAQLAAAVPESALRLQPRYVTSLDNRFAKFAKSSTAALKELGLPYVPVSAVAKTSRSRAMTEKGEARFITTVVIIRSLTGGLEMTIDWVLIATHFKKFAISFLQKLWDSFKGKRLEAILKYQADFQDIYITAYANGQTSPINYDNLLGYDWKSLVTWTMNKLGIEQIANPDTPERTNPEHEFRKAYFKKMSSIQVRLNMINSVHGTLNPTFDKPGNAEEMIFDDRAIAKSWARAAVFTPSSQYNKEEAEEKLEHYKDLIEGVTTGLHNDHLFSINKGKVIALDYRKFKPHSSFFKALEKKNITEEAKFIEAVNYKNYLDAEFRSGKQCVRYEKETWENTCILSMQVVGRLRLKYDNMDLRVMGVPRPDIQIGERQHSRKKNPEKFKFCVDIYPTPSYLHTDNLDLIDIAVTTEPPRGSARGELPLWYDIHDQLIPDLWKKVLLSVAWIAHARAGSTAKTLHGHFAPILEEWEIQRLLEWGEGVGLFRRIMEGVDGWTTDEWWWLIVGSICASVQV